MSQSVQKTVPIRKLPSRLTIGEIEHDVTMPGRQPNPLEDVLMSLVPNSSVPVRGGHLVEIRSLVSSYRQRHGLPNRAFTVRDMGDHVRIWRRQP